jgi:PPK2 family polyphosphate:nucleotide phosphotransferase
MDKYRIEPGTRVDLSTWDPRDRSRFDGGKKASAAVLEMLNGRLRHLQELLYAQGKHKLLIVLQAMDTGGKDGVIRHVFRGVNPQGVKVASFKVPTAEELAHDYLWRIHKHTPGRGEVAIYNRSHYEDVLVVRVHELVPPEVWQRRYDHINAFERLLADEGTTILKFYLHISREEQRERLQSRLDDPEKQWKFNVGDLKDRALWGDFTAAYEDVLSKTSTQWAPWYVIPADRKWYRNLAIATLLVETLHNLDMAYPQPKDNLDDVEIV